MFGSRVQNLLEMFADMYWALQGPLILAIVPISSAIYIYLVRLQY